MNTKGPSSPAPNNDAIAMIEQSPSPRHCAAPTKRGEQRRQAVLDAALELFLEHGFAATSLDKVIEKAGGSRRTIYQMFGSKEGLLHAVVTEGCCSVLWELESGTLLEMSPQQALIRLGETFLSHIITPKGMKLYRLVVAESTHAPELGRRFMEAGPERLQALLLKYLRAAIDAGQLQLTHPEITARQFFGFIKGDLHFQAMFNGEFASQETLQAHIAAAVEVFLRGCQSAAAR